MYCILHSKSLLLKEDLVASVPLYFYFTSSFYLFFSSHLSPSSDFFISSLTSDLISHGGVGMRDGRVAWDPGRRPDLCVAWDWVCWCGAWCGAGHDEQHQEGVQAPYPRVHQEFFSAALFFKLLYFPSWFTQDIARMSSSSTRWRSPESQCPSTQSFVHMTPPPLLASC